MPTAIRAAVCREFRAPLTLETVTLRDPEPDEVRVRLEAVAVCHSDVSFVDGDWGGELPAVFGHEAVGRIVDTGERVVVTLIRSCGSCDRCQRGRTVACTSVAFRPSPLTDADGAPIGQGMSTAAFADEVVVHRSQVVPIADDLPAASAALLACGVITGVGSVRNTAEVEPGSSVAVIGVGGVGANVIQGARMAGAASIVAIDLHPDKLELAQALGATHTATPGDAIDVVMATTDGAGCDHVFVATGAPAALAAAPPLAGMFATIAIVGMPATGVVGTFDPSSLAAMSQRIVGSKMGATVIERDIPELVERYRAGELELDRLVSSTCSLDDINEALDAVRSGATLRTVMVFGDDTTTGPT